MATNNLFNLNLFVAIRIICFICIFVSNIRKQKNRHLINLNNVYPSRMSETKSFQYSGPPLADK